MPTAKKRPTDVEIDTSAFSEAIDRYVNGRATIDNPTMNDYVMHYGSTRAVGQKLVDAGFYTNLKSAMRQVQRLLKTPDLKVTKRTREALGSLKVADVPTRITVSGYASYDGGGSGWRKMKFSHVVSPSEMRRIISATRTEGNQEGLDTFIEIYGVPVNFTFLKADLAISIVSA